MRLQSPFPPSVILPPAAWSRWMWWIFAAFMGLTVIEQFAPPSVGFTLLKIAVAIWAVVSMVVLARHAPHIDPSTEHSGAGWVFLGYLLPIDGAGRFIPHWIVDYWKRYLIHLAVPSGFCSCCAGG